MTVIAAAGLSIGSLYALMGQALPAGVSAAADGSASNPALAMIAASNASAGMEVMTLLSTLGTGAPSAAATAGADAAVFRASALANALASLSYLDPARELSMMGVDVAGA